ncbi:hypothetical protein [Saccharothrix xinjiangensis]|uniref:Uncharacterized protein n=1 Tax=Saccharothrix xinjiangensis TaxID=204798 RepID=A0ABV9Y187_9PSEU
MGAPRTTAPRRVRPHLSPHPLLHPPLSTSGDRKACTSHLTRLLRVELGRKMVRTAQAV